MSESSSPVDSGALPRNNVTSTKSRSDTPGGPLTEMPNESYQVGPGRPPKEFQFKKGQSGNPRGTKRKTPSIASDFKTLLERALNKKITLRQANRERIVTMAEAGIEHLVNRYAQGDRHARRDLMRLAEKLGVDLGAGQRKALEEALAPNHQTIIDAYIARQKDVKAPAMSSPVMAPSELLDDDVENSKSE